MKLLLVITLYCMLVQNGICTPNPEVCITYSTCKTCGSKTDLRRWTEIRDTSYGDDFSVIQALKKIAYDKKSKSKFDDYFFRNYGAYYLYTFLGSSPDSNRINIVKYLLENGVHPYDRISANTSLARYAIIFNDIKGFELMKNSGKLNDCKSELDILSLEAKRRGNAYFIEAIEILIGL